MVGLLTDFMINGHNLLFCPLVTPSLGALSRITNPLTNQQLFPVYSFRGVLKMRTWRMGSWP